MRAELTDYQVLTFMGHTGSKAHEIALDAQRGDTVAAARIEVQRAIIERRNAELRGVVQ